jgi:hypothetical protein
MQPDPSYLNQWGELGTLKNCLAGYFNQDWAVDYKSVEDAWHAVVREGEADFRSRLLEQLDVLLQRADSEVHALFHDTVDGLYFIEATDTRQWLEEFRRFLHSHGKA